MNALLTMLLVLLYDKTRFPKSDSKGKLYGTQSFNATFQDTWQWECGFHLPKLQQGSPGTNKSRSERNQYRWRGRSNEL